MYVNNKKYCQKVFFLYCVSTIQLNFICITFINSISILVTVIECDPVKASAEKISSSSSNECPLNSNCVELGTKNESKVLGLCACKTNYTVNKDYSSSEKSVYCVERTDSSPHTTIASNAANNSNPSTPTNNVATTKSTLAASTLASPLSSASPTLPTLAPTVQPTEKPNNESSTKDKSDNDKHEENNKKGNNGTVTNNNSGNKPQPEAHHYLGGIILPLMFVLAFVGAVFAVRKYDLIERTQTFIRNRRGMGQPHQTRYDGLENDFDDDPLLI